MRPVFLITLFFAAFCLLSGCTNKVEDFSNEPLTDYLPLQTGKYITYRLDSTVFTSLGRAIETHSYLEKNVVDAQITDNLDRPSFRIFRYLRDTAATQPWTSAGTYYITPMGNTIEQIDNNFRTIKLAAPLEDGATWKGNRFLADDPYHSLYNFTSVDNNKISDWDYTYSGPATESIGGKSYNDVLTVNQVDLQFNMQNERPRLDTVAASHTYGVEKYAKSIGLVYQQLIMWEYQPNLTGPSAYFTGFGVKRTVFDHN